MTLTPLRPARPVRPERCCKRLGVVRQIGVNDQAEIGQVDAARRHVGGDADAGAAVAQRLQRMGALALRQFAGQRDHREAALQQRGLQMIDRIARVAEHQRAGRFKKPQHVDDRVFDIGRRDPDGAILDVDMAALAAGDFDAMGVLLILLGERDDAARQGRREQQRAAFFRRGLEDEFEILAKAEIEHLVGLVEHDGFELRDVETAAPQMIAQPARRADHDMGAVGQFALLAPRVHAADAGDDARAAILIKPGQFALHLHRQFAGRRDDQGDRLGAAVETVGVAEQVLGDRQAIGHGLAGAGLRRHQKVAADSGFGQHAGLDRRQIGVIAFSQGTGEMRAGQARMSRDIGPWLSEKQGVAPAVSPARGSDKALTTGKFDGMSDVGLL